MKKLVLLQRDEPREPRKKGLYDINWSALQGFPPLRKTVSLHVKNYDNFSRVFEVAREIQS